MTVSKLPYLIIYDRGDVLRRRMTGTPGKHLLREVLDLELCTLAVEEGLEALKDIARRYYLGFVMKEPWSPN